VTSAPAPDVSGDKEVMLVVGEASGDAYGAQLVRAMRERDPNVKIYGVAGEQLEKTAFEPLWNVSKLTGMGLGELAGNLGNIWHCYRLLIRTLKERRPHLLVLIDFPDFNLRLAKVARRLGIPVLYYVSPQIWAWRRRRVKQIARNVSRMAVIFPFEVAFYEKHGVPVTFVGHPLSDSVKVRESRDVILRKLGFSPEQPTIVMLPGSRRREVEYHLPVMLRAAARLEQSRRIQFICVRAGTISADTIDAITSSSNFRLTVASENRYDVIHAADLVWTASGTATVETALLLKPMIIVYRLSPLTYAAAKHLVRVEHVGMANLMAGKRVAPELIQSQFTAERLVRESEIILDTAAIRESMVREWKKLKDRLTASGAAEKVADLALATMA
jgi:lipid-A-disaccharide synthase